MTVTDPKDVSAAALRALRWEQGSLVPEAAVVLSTLTWAHPVTQAVSGAGKAAEAERRKRDVETLSEPFVYRRNPKQGERLMVTTQTCDIIKDAGAFPQVEVARVFTTTKISTTAEAQNIGSTRFFRLNPVEETPALILDFSWRTFLDKGFLVEHDPDNSVLESWGLERRRTFARWLGRRYSRPVLSDEDDAEIAAPVRERWKRLIEEEPETAREYSNAYAEFRFRREEDGTLTIFLLSSDPEPDAEVALEIAAILVEVLEPVHGQVNFPSDRRSYHAFTVAELLTTEQIDLLSSSYDEGDVAGDLPEE